MTPKIALCLVLWVPCAVAVCKASDADSKYIIKELKTTGTRISYVPTTNFGAGSDSVFDSVYYCLHRRNAEILAYDRGDGIVTWCDTGGLFVPLPTDDSFDTMDQVSDAVSPRAGGYTYGTALVTRLTNQMSQLYVYSMGRSPDIADKLYSNGTYERELINEVARHLYKVRVGQDTQAAPPPPPKREIAMPATSYASAFRSRFRTIPSYPTTAIGTNIQGVPYSVPTEQLWTSLLRIVAQYDVVIDIQPEEHKVLFARMVSIPNTPNPLNTNATRQADALMFAFVEPQLTNSCLYFLGVLDQRTLQLMPVVGQNSVGKDLKLPALENVPNFMTAAAVIASQLDRQLDSQMFYAERWGDKFLRRNTESSAQP